MSVIVRGKNPNKPYTVRFWVDGKQRERSFRTRKEADDFKIKTDHDVRAQIFVDDRAWPSEVRRRGYRVAGPQGHSRGHQAKLPVDSRCPRQSGYR